MPDEIESQADKIISLNELATDSVTKTDLVALLKSTTSKAGRENLIKKIQKDNPSVFLAFIKLSDDLQLVENLLRTFTRPTIANPTVNVNPVLSQDPVQEPDFYDDFLAWAAAGGRSQLGWTFSSSGAGASGTPVAAVLGHPGIVELTTPAAINGMSRIHLGAGAADQPIVINDISRFNWIVSTLTADCFSRMGLIQNINQAAAAIQDAIFFELSTAALGIGTWHAKIIQAGVLVADISMNVANFGIGSRGWNKFECIINADLNVDFYANNELLGSVDRTAWPIDPFGTQFNYGAVVQSKVAVAKVWAIDFTRITFQDFNVAYPDNSDDGNRRG